MPPTNRSIILGLDTITKTGVQNCLVLKWAIKHFLVDGDEEIERALESHIRTILFQTRGNHEVQVHVTLIKGDPREAITALAARVNPAAVLVGRRSLGAVRRALMGSVSDHLARECGSTIVIVKSDD
ncbi:hypothetical protein BDK51DRAFT_27407 [Blyttiomyces helicus]|uniref:UspA domain-containing protein n=1 Tax=Blyttiomyces helicus TaxID=388810 RepID=A0A4P9W3D7_9FUNG|nr:hypothetical protein BDK51DRAFT_27407 [Blyttiomyces helicus]|eukprot:RKO86831.1 hypothetical protein BDK51DRAFT_27407 [Blyttiomyces helicus]